MTSKTIYLAGPEVFLPGAVAFGAAKKALCAAYGFEGLFPLDNEITKAEQRDRVDLAIYRANVAMIRRADIVIVNLTPFRGPSADVGSVFELGLAIGLGKAVFGYTNVASDLVQRVAGAVRDDAGLWSDPDGLSVEDFGDADNLMIDCCLAEASHPIIRASVDPARLYDDLGGFEVCLRLAADEARAAQR